MYLRLNDATAKVEDGGDAAGKAPELALSVPLAAGRLDDGVQRLLMDLRLDEDHLRCARPYGLAAHQQLNSRVADLASGIRPVPDADQSVSVATSQFDRAAVGWGQGLDDAMSAAFCLHRQWRPNTVGGEA
jgi:hypothetical protein